MHLDTAWFARCDLNAENTGSRRTRAAESGAENYTQKIRKKMIPKSFSASAFQVAETCLARYHAENILKTERPANKAADLGTTVHAALEWYVKAVYIDKTKPASLQALLMIYRMMFCTTFDTVDPDQHEMYAEGADMLKRWFARTDFSNREVISVETKTNFSIKTSIGDIPFNYIWDRFDRITDQEETYEVVDYKSIRRMLSPEDLRKKIQARFYGLAAQIQVPTAKRIWVRFDLLRHDSVATVFTRDDNKATWEFAKRLAEKIISIAPEDVTESLNPECCFCVRKAACKALTSNVTGGGLWSLTSTADRVNKRALLEFQRKGLDSLMAELDEMILKELAETDEPSIETDLYRAKATQSSRRAVDAERVQHVIGKELFYKYGGIRLTMADFGKLKKDPSLTDSQKKQLDGLVYRTAGELRVAIEPKNPIDED